MLPIRFSPSAFTKKRMKLQSRKITKYDEDRRAEISVSLDGKDDVTAIEIFLYCPVPLYKFNLLNIFQCGGCQNARNQKT
jgi:hypothetical protein